MDFASADQATANAEREQDALNADSSSRSDQAHSEAGSPGLHHDQGPLQDSTVKTRENESVMKERVQLSSHQTKETLPRSANSPPFDHAMKSSVRKIPQLKINASPRKGELWTQRLKEEYSSLIKYVNMNKENDQDWFEVKSNLAGTEWEGKCWYYHDNMRYEFDMCFSIPIGYPQTPPEIRIPELDGKTAKMYHGAKICLTVHFNPLWARNAPSFGIAHALALGLGPWLAAEVPQLVARNAILPKV